LVVSEFCEVRSLGSLRSLGMSAWLGTCEYVADFRGGKAQASRHQSLGTGTWIAVMDDARQKSASASWVDHMDCIARREAELAMQSMWSKSGLELAGRHDTIVCLVRKTKLSFRPQRSGEPESIVPVALPALQHQRPCGQF